jgi:hypothetical protein
VPPRRIAALVSGWWMWGALLIATSSTELTEFSFC